MAESKDDVKSYSFNCAARQDNSEVSKDNDRNSTDEDRDYRHPHSEELTQPAEKSKKKKRKKRKKTTRVTSKTETIASTECERHELDSSEKLPVDIGMQELIAKRIAAIESGAIEQKSIKPATKNKKSLSQDEKYSTTAISENETVSHFYEVRKASGSNQSTMHQCVLKPLRNSQNILGERKENASVSSENVTNIIVPLDAKESKYEIKYKNLETSYAENVVVLNFKNLTDDPLRPLFFIDKATQTDPIEENLNIPKQTDIKSDSALNSDSKSAATASNLQLPSEESNLQNVSSVNFSDKFGSSLSSCNQNLQMIRDDFLTELKALNDKFENDFIKCLKNEKSLA